ncbi:hypothetical protein O181_062870 [Austropuccinia psidii MF-1]|uniref:Uncharacterized protein n=1 Tax=Austropuccinia psidii MF-1 TaxID=1389203 RepID=A0A9Q3EHS1_9BASI|nr:hypothetical protein [Austropuccinia psidii MF-1]
MSAPCYSSMHICMCQNYLTQTHCSPEGDRQGVSFTPSKYKQHIKNLKTTIETNAISNIPTFALASECPQILFDQIFPNDYSQLNQRNISTTPGLNSTALKPYIGSKNLPLQDF